MLITENNRKHYVAIKSLSRLLSKQNSKHKEAQHICLNCLQGFWEESSRDEQVRYCKNNELVRIEMPHKKPIVEYSDGQFQFKVPFIIYADFESILELYKDQVTTLGNHQRTALMYIPHLNGVLIPSSLMEKS